MRAQYENPTLYSAVNQPVDKKTGLVVQQEVPVTQLGRMSQKHDQGFLDFVADRAVAKYYAKKGKRGTAIFLPDRVRFTRNKFRDTLFYREIKEFYKSDPKTFCFVLYVFDEKTAKRTYEVYQCDTLQDVHRIEDLLEMSKHTVNCLLVDPVPVPPLSEQRRSLSMPPDKQKVLECPHCNHLSRVGSVHSLTPSEPLSEPTYRSDRYEVQKSTIPRAISGVALNQQQDDWIHINDRWRDTNEYADNMYLRRQTKNPARSTWYENDGNNGYIARQPTRKSYNPKYRTGVQVRPYHTTSTYGRPRSLNREDETKKLLQSGKPRLNRETMQIEQPYVPQPQTRTQTHQRSVQSNYFYHEPDEPIRPKDSEIIFDSSITKPQNVAREQHEQPYPVIENSDKFPMPMNPCDCIDQNDLVPNNTIVPVQQVKQNATKPLENDFCKSTVTIEWQTNGNNQYPNKNDVTNGIIQAMYAKRFDTEYPLDEENGSNDLVNGSPIMLNNTYALFKPNEATQSNVIIVYENDPSSVTERYVSPF